jgi:hypothetical protein
MAFKVGDRVVLQSQFTTPDKKIVEAGTLCTILSFLSDEMVIVRYGYDTENDNELVLGVPTSLLKHASVDELEEAEAEVEKLVSKAFHIGQQWMTGPNIKFKEIEPNTKGTIVGVILGVNESEDLVDVDFGNDEIHELKRDFVQKNFFKYIPELEENLGDEVIMKGATKNFHIIGARMIAEDTNEIVILIAKAQDDEELFLVEDLNGNQMAYKKEYLTPLTNPESLYQLPHEKVIQNVCLPDKSFIANENIDKHVLLKDEFKPNDVVKIINIESVNHNAFEDTFRVQRTGGDKVVVSYAELRHYFKPYKGLIKNTKNVGKVEEVISEAELEEIFQKNEVKTIELAGEETPIVEENVIDTKPKVQIHDISINGIRFKINDGKVDIPLNAFYVDEIDNLIEALGILKQYI